MDAQVYDVAIAATAERADNCDYLLKTEFKSLLTSESLSLNSVESAELAELK